MSRLQCCAAFVKATNDISMEDKWIPDDDWVRNIHNKDGLKDCKVSHMNRSISSKRLFTNNQYISPENNKTILWNKQRIVPKKSTAIKILIHFYYVVSSATSSIPTIRRDTKPWQAIWDDKDRSSHRSLKRDIRTTSTIRCSWSIRLKRKRKN
jgi:hypothetical protein